MHMILTKLLLPVKTNIERYATRQSYGIKSQEIQDWLSSSEISPCY